MQRQDGVLFTRQAGAAMSREALLVRDAAAELARRAIAHAAAVDLDRTVTRGRRLEAQRLADAAESLRVRVVLFEDLVVRGKTRRGPS
jgi:hypothetical protein